jgi:hypothetical protein
MTGREAALRRKRKNEVHAKLIEQKQKKLHDRNTKYELDADVE